MPSLTTQEVIADLRIPNLSVQEAEDLFVDLIQWRKVEGVERIQVARELESVVKQTPTRLLSALENAKERTLMAPAAFSPVAFSISATRLQVTSFLAKEGIANPSVAREVLLEYVARKERIVSAWPGGVRASIEVVQGGLRDVWIELRASPLAHLVEQIQLETGHISLSQLMGFLRSFSPAPTTEASKREFQTRSLPGIEKALKNWANAGLLGGSGRYEVGIELEEIKKQIGPHLYPVFPLVLRSLYLPPSPIHPHARGLASDTSLILPAIQGYPEPDFVEEILSEWVSWGRRRTPGAWGRSERVEMANKFVNLERLLTEKMSFPHLAPVFQRVRFNTRCPSFDFAPPTKVPTPTARSTPYAITTNLSLVPRTLSDVEVEIMLQDFVDEERKKAKTSGPSSRMDGGWGSAETRRVGDVLETMREKINDHTLDPIFGFILARNGLLRAESDPGFPTPTLTLPSSTDLHSDDTSPELTPPPATILVTSASPRRLIPAIPSAPVISRRVTSESPELSVLSVPSQPIRRQTSEPAATADTPSTSILLTSRKTAIFEPVAVVVSEPDSLAASPPDTEASPLPSADVVEPDRPTKSKRRFGLFGSKPKVESPGQETKKASPKPSPKVVASKKGPPSVPKSVSTPKSKVQTPEDVQLKRNTLANATIDGHKTPTTTSPPATMSRNSTIQIIEAALTPPPITKTLSFAESSHSSTSSTSSQKKEKEKRVLVKARKTPSASSTLEPSPKEIVNARRSSEVAPLGAFLSADGPSAISLSTGDLPGRLARSQSSAASPTERVPGFATLRSRKVYHSDSSVRPKSMVDLSKAGEREKEEKETKSRRFSFFGKKTKEDRFPPLEDPPQGLLIDDDIPRRWSRSSSSLSLAALDNRPRSQFVLDSESFPDFSTMRAPHQLRGPSPVSDAQPSAQPSPRQQWRSPAPFASSSSLARRGTSTPPILEVDSDHSEAGEPTRRELGMSLIEALESDPGHGGVIIDEQETLPVPIPAPGPVYHLTDAQAQPVFDLTRKIDPPPASPPLGPPAEPIPTSFFSQPPTSVVDELASPPLSPRPSIAAPAPTSTLTLGRTPRIPPNPTLEMSSVVSRTSLPPPARRASANDFKGDDTHAALSTVFSSPVFNTTVTRPLPPPIQTSPAPKRALPGVPPAASPTTSVRSSDSLSAGPSFTATEERIPPVLTVRAVFEALSPTEYHSTGKVLDILMGFIDRERERSLLQDKKKGWGETERTKVGWILSEIEESLVPNNPHLSAVIERVRNLTDCPPQAKTKRRSSSKRLSRSATSDSTTSLSSLSSMSSASTSTSITSIGTENSRASEFSVASDATGTTRTSGASSDSDDTVTHHHAQPSSPIINQWREDTQLDRSSSTRTIVDARRERPATSPPVGPRPFVPRSSFDQDPSSPVSPQAAALLRSKTIHGNASPSTSYFIQQPTEAATSGSTPPLAPPPPPYERARRISSMRVEGSA